MAVGPGGTILASGGFITLALTGSPGNAQLTLSLTGPTGLGYAVERSSDLISWQAVTNLTSVQPTTLIPTAATAGAEHAFYRAYTQ